MRARTSWRLSARPKCTAAGVWNPTPEWRWSWLYHLKKPRQKARPSSMEPKRSGNSGRYLRVLNWASEYGLSLEQWGREWLLMTPRSANRRATVFEAMDVPRSAWIVKLVDDDVRICGWFQPISAQ